MVSHVYFALLLFMLLPYLDQIPARDCDSPRKLYIVYMGERKSTDPTIVSATHHDFLTSILGSKEAANRSIVYSYKHGFSGFAAMLTDSEAKEVEESSEVQHVRLSRDHELATTRSWDFLGMNYPNPPEVLQKSKWGEDVIIGIIDTGIWPESKSFDDRGYGPIPTRWKGKCESGQSFNSSNCNNKIIGARWYTGGFDPEVINASYASPRDSDGHGTHTASTAAGSVIEDLSYNGLAKGLARGGAPRARIAVYKAVWGSGLMRRGNDATVLAAIDDAIHDGVDVLSLSLVAPEQSFGSFHAVAKGIVMVYAGGNIGPMPQTVRNLAPWVITVAASTIDRSFPTVITLGNNLTLVGQALYYQPGKDANEFKEAVFGNSCDADSLNGTSVAGKVVLCIDATLQLLAQAAIPTLNVVKAGGKGIIFVKFMSNIIGLPRGVIKDNRQIPIVLVDISVGNLVLSYIQSASKAVVKITPTVTVIGSEVQAPKIAAFSSRGPNVLLPGVLKPDISAPGVNILAALLDSFELGSGTSMATPHIAGIAAVIKSLHPNWSPAAIKSALMTTASVTDAYGVPIEASGFPAKIADPFDFGAGNANPIKAADPGLVYDIEPNEYNDFIVCSLGAAVICKAIRPAYHLNLPSITIPNLQTSITISRTVTNVASVDAIYRLTFESPPGTRMDVSPNMLIFNATTKNHTFRVSFMPQRKFQGNYVFGSLTWYDHKHQVRIPIAVRTVIENFYADVA